MRISSWALGFVSLALSSTIHAQGVQTQIQPMRWSAGGGTAVPYAFSSTVDLKNGEVTGYTLGASIPYRFSVTGTIDNPFETGLVGRVYDTWSMTQFRQQYLGYAEVNCLGGTAAPCNSQVDVRNYQGGTLNFGESIPEPVRFNVMAPDAYHPTSFGLSGQLAVSSAFDNSNRPGFPNVLQPVIGSLSSYSQDTQATINYSIAQRPWTVTELLADRVRPVIDRDGQASRISVNLQPRFGYTVQEAARLGGYSHFNWLQEILEIRTGVFGPPFDRVTYSTAAGNLAEISRLLGRGTGYDPGIGCYFDPAFRDCSAPEDITDLSALYWDEANAARNLVPGGPDFRWQAWNFGGQFQDVPNLLYRGFEADFRTQLVGVRDDGTFDVLSNLPIPNFDDFTFNWRFTQLSDWESDGNTGDRRIGMLQNVSWGLGGAGLIQLLDANGVPIGDPVGGDPGSGGGGGGSGGIVPPIGVPIPGAGSLCLIGVLSAIAMRRREASATDGRATRRLQRNPSD